MKEAEFTNALLDLLGRLGWMAIHQRPNVNRSGRWSTAVQGPGSKGWPDIFAVRGTRALAAELKVGKNRPALEQWEWLQALDRAGVETYVWTDKDWASGEIEVVLR